MLNYDKLNQHIHRLIVWTEADYLIMLTGSTSVLHRFIEHEIACLRQFILLQSNIDQQLAREHIVSILDKSANESISMLTEVLKTQEII